MLCPPYALFRVNSFIFIVTDVSLFIEASVLIFFKKLGTTAKYNNETLASYLNNVIR